MVQAKPKPFCVWPPDREHPFRYATYGEAERYAKRSVHRTGASIYVTLGLAGGGRLAMLSPSGDNRVQIDMMPEGTTYA